ncbi:MAG: hypothetical protein QOI61_232 [Actinomycetota bacterium]|jgi:hypothetical protein
MNSRPRVQLAYAAIVGVVLFTGGSLLFGAIEGHGYSAAKHYISDLGAPTAHNVLLMLTAEALCGVAVGAFALGALRPSLAPAGRRASIAAWLIVLSVIVFDNITDLFFRLDCRLADAGCSASDQMESWHGKVHIYKFVIALVASVAAPFVLASCMKAVDGWRDLVRPTRIFGGVFVAGAVALAALDGTDVQGTAQRLLAAFVCAGVAALAVRVIRLES